MQCKELEAVLEQEGLSPLPADAREHLAACTACQDFLADLSAILVAAKGISAEVKPPERIWLSLRTQLEAEGIIHSDIEPVVTPEVAPWWHGFAEFFRPRVLATVGAGVFLVLGSVYFVKRPHSSVATVNPPAPSVQVNHALETTAPPAPQANAVAPPKKAEPKTTLSARVSSAGQRHTPSTGLKPSPSENMYLAGSAALLSQTENDLPRHQLTSNAAVDASLRQNLRTLNEFIAECEARLKQNPKDQLTREYLNMAYQQKAELLTAMMDTGRSEQ